MLRLVKQWEDKKLDNVRDKQHNFYLRKQHVRDKDQLLCWAQPRKAISLRASNIEKSGAAE